jgi:fatty acid desaturase
MSDAAPTMSGEERTEAFLRRFPCAIPALTLLTAAALYAAIGGCLSLYRSGISAVVVLSGLLVHAFMIVLVHDGAHRAITGTRADSLLMNLGCGLLLLPFYGELFRRYHLIHHAHTNESGDPLWPSFKKRMYVEHRGLYMLAELVPFVFTVLALATGAPREPSRRARGPRVRPWFMALSLAVAAGIAWWVRPPGPFLVWTVLCANAWNVLRHWCEHVGFDPGKDSNTYRFPLGMGIGNHDAHHRHPGFSWISMAVGLTRRPKDTGPLRTVWAMLRRADYLPYAVVRDIHARP